MYNEFDQHKKKDRIKWIIVFSALILLVFSVVTLAVKSFAEPDEATKESVEIKQEEKTEPNAPVTSEGALNTVEVISSDIMLMSTAYASPTPTHSDGSVHITATVLPLGSSQQLMWAVSYVNPDDEFAKQNPDANIFVSVTTTNENKTEAEVRCLAPFGAQIKIKATSVQNPSISGYIVVDYIERLGEWQLFDVLPGGFFEEGASNNYNHVTGITYDTAENMARMYGEHIQLGELTENCGTVQAVFESAEYTLRISDRFQQDLQMRGFASMAGDTKLGNDGFTAAEIINTLVGETLVPLTGEDTVDLDDIVAFNEVAVNLGEYIAFTIEVKVKTEVDTRFYNFDFHFNQDTLRSYVEEVNLNENGIVF